MSLEKKEIVRRFIEALNKQDLTLLDDLVAPDYVDMQLQGVESVKQTMKMFYKGFPDVHTTMEDIIAISYFQNIHNTLLWYNDTFREKGVC